MKKVINGKLYNTDSAEEVASWSNGYRMRRKWEEIEKERGDSSVVGPNRPNTDKESMCLRHPMCLNYSIGILDW